VVFLLLAGSGGWGGGRQFVILGLMEA